ncbi:MAG: amidohydrolase family protein [Phycisphaerales bacterium]
MTTIPLASRRDSARLLALFATALLALAASPHTALAQPDDAPTTQPADLIIENARIWSDGLPAFARFAAVRDGRFVHVGEPDLALIGPDTARLDAQNRVVIPGLIDSHIHMLGGGAGLAGLQLRDASDRAEFVRRVAERAVTLRPGEWITGGRWSTDSWSDPTFPDRSWIDEATPNNPALITRMDGHSALANSLALQLAEITRDSPPDPPGGVIDRDADGNPTGILRESAVQLVARLIPTQSTDRTAEALQGRLRRGRGPRDHRRRRHPGLSDLPAYERPGRRPALDPVLPLSHRRRLAGRGHGVQWFEGANAWVRSTASRRISTARSHRVMSEPFLPARRLDDARPAARGRRRWRVPDERPGRAAGRRAGHCPRDRRRGQRLLLGHRRGLRLRPTITRDARARSEHAQHLSAAEIARFGSAPA